MVANHDGISVAGFPSRFDLTVSGVSLADPAAGIGWQAPFAQIFAMTWKPWHLIAALPPEQTVTLPDQSLTVTSARMRGSLLLVPGDDLALNEFVVETEGAKVASTLGWTLAADKAVASTRLDGSRKNGHRLGLSVQGFAPDPGFVAATGLAVALEDIHLDATAVFSAPLDRHVGESQPHLLSFDLTEGRLLWGDFKIFAKGALAADAAGFASGEISFRVEDWQALPKVLAAMGVIAPDLVPSLTKGLEVMAKSGPDPKVLILLLKAQDGRMSLGPFPLGPAPLWN